MKCFIVLLTFVYAYEVSSYEEGTYSILMPNVVPPKPETYYCTPVRIESGKTFYITGFKPNSTMATAHHMLLYGCKKPGQDSELWNCGEMAAPDPNYKQAPPCRSGSQVIYAWAMDAPSLQLPEDVGFRVGKDSEVNYLVLQVHYAVVDKFQDGSTDDSGVFLTYTERPQSKAAGVLLLATGGLVPPLSPEKMEVQCEIDENKVIHPFAFRIHTHALGQVVSGYKVQKHGRSYDWQLIGKRDPQLPQMFYPVFDYSPITKGDILAARCTMYNFRKRITFIGPTKEDEMCNFYLMYWVDGTDSMKKKYCQSYGPPLYRWKYHLGDIPEEDASTLP